MADDKQKNEALIDGMKKKRSVALQGVVDPDKVDAIIGSMLSLQMLSNEPINLVIDSSGGNLDSALKLCDLMSFVLAAPVRGVVLGQCSSAATFVLLHCKERLGTPHSKFLIHSGTRNNVAVPINQTSSENLEHLLKDVKATEERVVRFYMNRLTPQVWGQREVLEEEKRQFVQKLLDRGDQLFNKYLTAEEAVEVGLINRIITEKLDIFSE